VLGMPVSYDPALFDDRERDILPKAPGMKYRHYAPAAEMIVFRGSPQATARAIEARRVQEEQAGRSVGILVYSGTENRLIAREFFAKLRAMDETGIDLILATAVSEDDPIGFSIMNRMLKAAGYRIEEVAT